MQRDERILSLGFLIELRDMARVDRGNDYSCYICLGYEIDARSCMTLVYPRQLNRKHQALRISPQPL